MTKLLEFIINPVHASNIIGTITPPANIPSNPVATTGFLRAILVFIMVVAGIFSFWQIILSGFNYITAGGDKGKVEIAQQKLNHALIGLVIIAASFIIAAIAGQILFDNPSFILNPKIETVLP
jgi:hypothetical protein